MQPYYDHYGVDWQLEKIVEQIQTLENYDILCNGAVIGAIRLAFDLDGCYLRDLQVAEMYRNQGIGAKAILQIEQMVIDKGLQNLRLRVFKISPASHLYLRCGFETTEEDDRFLYMSKSLMEKFEKRII